MNKETYLQVIYVYESSATIFVILGKTHYYEGGLISFAST